MEDKNFSEIFSAKEPCASYEGVLQKRWTTIPLDTKFRTVCGKQLIILSRGTWNLESGPDFLNAKISLNDKIITGDIEIHTKTSDWKAHGHSKDPAFANVILHVVETHDAPDHWLPVFPLPAENKTGKIPIFLKDPAGTCLSYFKTMPDEQLLKFFQDAGLDRLQKKSKLILSDMIEHGTKHAFLSKLFDVLGFRKNREAFAVLFRETVLKYPAGTFDSSCEEILWGESGLLPADQSSMPDPEAKAEQLRLWNAWWKLRRDAGERIHWNRSALRPANTPERRIAALCEFIRKNGTDPLPGWMKMLEGSDSPEICAEKLQEAFYCEGGFWADRVSFSAQKQKKKSALIGKQKALEIVIDAVLPCLAALAELEGKTRAAARLRILMKALPSPETNSVVRKASALWFKEPENTLKLLNNAAARQGIHHIYAEYCAASSGDCSLCLIKNSFRPIDGR
ncbi:MAG: DUF2851 family protein [Lentisphaeria bacterium]|nr:DUF2851 family protein [Lentisphaeria bacterium]